MKKTIIALSLMMLTLHVAKATTSTKDTLPTVFMLGQFDGVGFEELKAAYSTQLLTVCKNDMETAYYVWIQLLKQMESHATRTGYDLNSVKMWLYVFWNKDGSIKNIAYYAKPNSRNFKEAEMTTFLKDFAKVYKTSLAHEQAFSHYSTANFPVMVEKQAVQTTTKGVQNRGQD